MALPPTWWWKGGEATWRFSREGRRKAHVPADRDSVSVQACVNAPATRRSRRADGALFTSRGLNCPCLEKHTWVRGSDGKVQDTFPGETGPPSRPVCPPRRDEGRPGRLRAAVPASVRSTSR